MINYYLLNSCENKIQNLATTHQATHFRPNLTPTMNKYTVSSYLVEI